MKKFKFIILLTITIFFLTGCFKKSELEDLAYVIAIGIDKGPEDNKIVSFQIAVPIKIAGEGSTGGKDTLYNSLSRADTMISKEITLSHNKIIVISEELAKEGIHEILNALVTNREIRPKTSILVYKGKAKEMLENLEPILEKNPTRYYDLLLDANEYTGYALDNNLFNFYVSSKDFLASPYALLTEPVKENESSIEIPSKSKSNPDSIPNTNNIETNNKNSENTIQENQGNNNKNEIKNSTGESQNNQSKEITDGQDNSKTSTPQTANIAGIAIFKNDKLAGEIRNEQIISHLLLQGQLQKVNIDIEDIKDAEKTTVIKLHQRERQKINVEIKNDTPKIDILLRIDCDLITSGSEIDYTDKENKHKLSENIKHKLKNDMHIYLIKIAKDFKTDPIGFGKYYRTKVSTIQELETLNWEKIFPNSEYT